MYPDCPVAKLISGGQTGVDRAALTVALFLEIPHGGWCPRGRRAEDGIIPTVYQMRETQETDYAARTERNVKEGDGTLILYRQRLTSGTALTNRLLKKHRRPVLLVDLAKEHSYQSVRDWLAAHGIQVLNVAGPRESSAPGITMETEQFLLNVFQGIPDAGEIGN